MSISPEWLRRRRWFAGKSRAIADVKVVDEVSLGALTWAILEVTYAHDVAERYSIGLPLSGEADAFQLPEAQRLLFVLLAEGAERGPLRFQPLTQLPVDPGPSRPLGVEQSNTSIRYGREWVLKLLRQVAPGQNRDLEVGSFLTLQAGFRHTPAVAGAVTYGDSTLGVLQRFVDNQGDGWSWVLDQLEPAPNAPDDVYWSQDGLPDRDQPLLDQIELLGRVTGEMHRALASRPDVPAFAPEPCTDADVAAWLDDLQRQRAASSSSDPLPRFDLHVNGIHKIQVHGDYHLGQVLKTAEGFTIVDFEGEPARPLAERRSKQPAMRDVAGMLRSLHYAAWATALASPSRGLESWAEGWAQYAGARFVQGWRDTSGQPLDADLLRLFQLAKAYYELAYELNNRPEWAQVPRRGIEALLRDG